MKKRLELKQLRVRLDLTQTEMGERIGVDRGTYASVENGQRDGGRKFWVALQRTFPELDDATIWRLMKNEEV